MSVSVVICAYTLDRWDDLEKAIRSCVTQSLAPEEIIVVIDHNDGLLERATLELKGVHVVANRSTKGLSGARNTGVVESSGEFVAFLDDDAFAEPEWLQHLTSPFADSSVVGVGGWVLPHWDASPPSWFPETFYWVLGCSYVGLAPDLARIRNPIGANMAMRRRVFTAVGGFTSGIGRIGSVPLGCEETELCIRYTERFPDERFVLARRAIVHHRVPAARLTWRYFWTRCWAEGLSKAAVTSLVGPRSGLAAERGHLQRYLLREFAHSIRSLARRPRTGAVRAALIVAGTTVAAAGLLRGALAVRRTPIVRNTRELELMMQRGDERESRPPVPRSAE